MATIKAKKKDVLRPSKSIFPLGCMQKFCPSTSSYAIPINLSISRSSFPTKSASQSLHQNPAPLVHWLHVESLSINVNGTGDKRQLQHPLGMGLAYCKANSRYNCTGIKQLATIGFISHSPIASPTRNPEVMLQMPSPCPQNTQRLIQKSNTHPQIQYQ